MDASERIQAILKAYNIQAPEFSKRIGVKTVQAIYDLMNGRTKSISASVENKILSVYPEISRGWLLTGDGDMFLNKESDKKNNMNGGEIRLPSSVWSVIERQSESLSARDRQIDELIGMLKDQIHDAKKVAAQRESGAASVGAVS